MVVEDHTWSICATLAEKTVDQTWLFDWQVHVPGRLHFGGSDCCCAQTSTLQSKEISFPNAKWFQANWYFVLRGCCFSNLDYPCNSKDLNLCYLVEHNHLGMHGKAFYQLQSHPLQMGSLPSQAFTLDWWNNRCRSDNVALRTPKLVEEPTTSVLMLSTRFSFSFPSFLFCRHRSWICPRLHIITSIRRTRDDGANQLEEQRRRVNRTLLERMVVKRVVDQHDAIDLTHPKRWW